MLERDDVLYSIYHTHHGARGGTELLKALIVDTGCGSGNKVFFSCTVYSVALLTYLITALSLSNTTKPIVFRSPASSDTASSSLPRLKSSSRISPGSQTSPLIHAQSTHIETFIPQRPGGTQNRHNTTARSSSHTSPLPNRTGLNTRVHSVPAQYTLPQHSAHVHSILLNLHKLHLPPNNALLTNTPIQLLPHAQL
jgi:hypothetical protein